MKVFVENIHSNMRNKDDDTTGGSRNKLKFLPQSHKWIPLFNVNYILLLDEKPVETLVYILWTGNSQNSKRSLYFSCLFV